MSFATSPIICRVLSARCDRENLLSMLFIDNQTEVYSAIILMKMSPYVIAINHPQYDQMVRIADLITLIDERPIQTLCVHISR